MGLRPAFLQIEFQDRQGYTHTEKPVSKNERKKKAFSILSPLVTRVIKVATMLVSKLCRVFHWCSKSL